MDLTIPKEEASEDIRHDVFGLLAPHNDGDHVTPSMAASVQPGYDPLAVTMRALTSTPSRGEN